MKALDELEVIQHLCKQHYKSQSTLFLVRSVTVYQLGIVGERPLDYLDFSRLSQKPLVLLLLYV